MTALTPSGRWRQPHMRACAKLMAVATIGLAGGCGGEADLRPAAPGANLPPSAVDRRLDRSIDSIVSAYDPVTRRLNYIVAAERLYVDGTRTDGVEGDARAERTTALLEEIATSRAMLESSRERLVKLEVEPSLRAARRLCIAAVSARIRSLASLGAMVVADRAGSREPAREAEDRWRADWNRSLRNARVALNIIQALREEAGLPPAPEGAIR